MFHHGSLDHMSLIGRSRFFTIRDKMIHTMSFYIITDLIAHFRWMTYLPYIIEKCQQMCGMREYIDHNYVFADYFYTAHHEFISLWTKELRAHITAFNSAADVLRRFCKRFVAPYYSERHFDVGTLIVRNRKDGLPDQRMAFRFRPSHPYWSTAFSGRFSKDMIEGQNTFLLRVGQMGISVETIKMYCSLTFERHQDDRQKILEDFLLNGKEKDPYEVFCEKIQMCASLFQMWCDDPYQVLIENIMTKYINKTLHNKGFSSLRRLELFIKQDQYLSRYIWETNFSSEKERRCLGVAMGISVKQLGGFVRSDTQDQLMEWIQRKKQPVGTKYDKLPDHLQREITQKQELLDRARRGTGIYISSDEINACERNLFDAWRKADKWIGQNHI